MSCVGYSVAALRPFACRGWGIHLLWALACKIETQFVTLCSVLRECLGETRIFVEVPSRRMACACGSSDCRGSSCAHLRRLFRQDACWHNAGGALSQFGGYLSGCFSDTVSREAGQHDHANHVWHQSQHPLSSSGPLSPIRKVRPFLSWCSPVQPQRAS